MKALIIVTVLAMATSAIAVPLSRQAKAQALLAVMQDIAEMEGSLRGIKKLDPRLLDDGDARMQLQSLPNVYNRVALNRQDIDLLSESFETVTNALKAITNSLKAFSNALKVNKAMINKNNNAILNLKTAFETNHE